jgi:arylformamidase
MKIVDLTVAITPNIKIFSGYPQPMFIKWSKLEIHGYDSEVIFLSTHTGTHIDAPSHFRVGLMAPTTTIDGVAVNRFVCRALLLKVLKGANQTITYKDIIKQL